MLKKIAEILGAFVGLAAGLMLLVGLYVAPFNIWLATCGGVLLFWLVVRHFGGSDKRERGNKEGTTGTDHE